MKHKLSLVGKVPLEQLTEQLKKIEFRGVYTNEGNIAKPYKFAKFCLTSVTPPKFFGDSPKIKVNDHEEILFSPQPTVYQNQLDIIKVVDEFLTDNNMRVHQLEGAVEYIWEGRGSYHMIPPIIEHHTYDLKGGFINFRKLLKKFDDLRVKDAAGRFHKISSRYLKKFYIDEVSAIRDMDIFHNNAQLFNYGLKNNGKIDFYIVCDGSHRIDYAIETLNEPINVILVEAEQFDLVPYYAFPMSFMPTIRLSSKSSEKMYPRLERDKVHLFNDFLKKVLHYDWDNSGLNVSKLRSNLEM